MSGLEPGKNDRVILLSGCFPQGAVLRSTLWTCVLEATPVGKKFDPRLQRRCRARLRGLFQPIDGLISEPIELVGILSYAAHDVLSFQQLHRRCLTQRMRRVEGTGQGLIVTDNNHPTVRIVPIRRQTPAAVTFGDVRGKVIYREDILTSTSDEWSGS